MSQYRRVSMLRSASEPGLPSLLLGAPCQSASSKFAVDFDTPLSPSGSRFLSKTFRPQSPQTHFESQFLDNPKVEADLLPVKSCLKRAVRPVPVGLFKAESCGGFQPIDEMSELRSARTSASSVVSFSGDTDGDAELEDSPSSSKRTKKKYTSRSAMFDDCCSSSQEDDPTSPRSPASPWREPEGRFHQDPRMARKHLFRDVHEHDRKITFQTEMHRANEKALRRSEQSTTGDFEVGELVTTLGGIEANGPWKAMGHGTVVGPGWQKGFLDVMYKDLEGNKERFAIRAKNLTKVSELHIEKHVRALSKSFGIKFGDAVTYKLHSKGVVVDEGPTPDTALVKFSGVGIRSVQLVHCLKVALKDEVDEKKHKTEYTSAERRTLRRLAAAEWAGVELTWEEGGLKPGQQPPVAGPKVKKHEKNARRVAISEM